MLLWGRPRRSIPTDLFFLLRSAIIHSPLSTIHYDMNPIVEKILAQDQLAGSRLMRRIDDNDPTATELLQALYPHTGRARILGVTGAPGAGKSTLVDRFVGELRSRQKTVAVVAVDPTSPFTGGAILGDRIRMQRHTMDPGVFIRSLATRGALGGLSRSTGDVVRVFDAMGYDYVIVETVGVGQDEVEIVKLADATLVVMVPGLGDDIQSIKAGILEIADVFVINKADREGADRLERDLKAMLELSEMMGPSEKPPPQVLRTVATKNEGVAAVIDQVEERIANLTDQQKKSLRKRRALAELTAVVEERIRQRARDILNGVTLDELAERKVDPYSLAEKLLGNP
jgi:LAO/AO transport system kinase